MSDSPDIEAIRLSLRFHMERTGLKGKALSKAAGLNESAVRDIFGKVADPRISTLLALAKALDVSPATLFGGTVPIAGLINGNGEILPILQDGEPLDRVPRPPEMVGDIAAYRVIGNGLSPAYRSGDVLFVSHRHDANPADFVNEECVVRLAATGAMLLRTITNAGTEGRFNLHSPKLGFLDDIQLAWGAPVLFVMRKRVNPHLSLRE